MENKKGKWCDKELINKRTDAIFCSRGCKGMYRRKKINEKEKRNK
jgi:hypothetical protein